ncbi:Transient receptor putative cation channel subfamily M member 2 [Cichlidogyrus casuarinus]|uniref:Transient receptor putative cation channel subfamily M member 2 n=1 Tax=Cichlidogyrus casuarinus TaxID=1844966 RepID=A0ABD2Q5Q9_9PLAT
MQEANADLDETQEESTIGSPTLSDFKHKKSSLKDNMANAALEFVERIKDFYMAPIVRFVYNTVSYVTFLLLFSYLLLVNFQINISVVEYIVIAWVVTLLIEEVKQVSAICLKNIKSRIQLFRPRFIRSVKEEMKFYVRA